MPFNRDLIESGCALKTFDGDLSVLERVIDWTVTKPGFADQQCKPFGYDVARRQRVLCTGGVGYIGSHTVVKLVEHGFQVAIADASLSTSVTVLERLRELTGENIPFFEVDMNDEVAIDRLFQEQQFDGVVHCAGLPADSGSAEDPMQFYESNVVGTMAVLKAMENHNCKHIVFSSSASVYEPSDQPITESQPLGPSCLFGRTKFMTEQILSDACQANKGLAVSVLRCFNTCGAHRSGRIGSEQSEMAFMSSMQQFGIRDCIHVDDVAEGHALAQEALHNGQRHHFPQPWFWQGRLGCRDGKGISADIQDDHWLQPDPTHAKPFVHIEQRKGKDGIGLAAEMRPCSDCRVCLQVED